MGETVTSDRLSVVAQAEQEAYELFKTNYALRVPPPVTPKALDITSVGFMFWLYLLQSVAAIILGASRTASMFYLAAAASGSVLLAQLEAGAAVFAIEGGIVVYAAARAINEKKTSGRTLVVALVFMAMISAIAGLGQSISLVENMDHSVLLYFQYLLAIILGLGSSVVVYVSGDVLGGQIAVVLSAYQENLRAFKGEYAKYISSMNAAWAKSDERKISRGELRIIRGPQDESPNKQSRLSQLGQPVGRDVGQPVGRDMGRFYQAEAKHGRDVSLGPKRATRNKAEICTHLDTEYQVSGRVPTVAETVRATGLPKSTVSRVRLDWLNNNGISQG
jgi:hypothetical protein